MPDSAADVRWIYGYGNTKHISDPSFDDRGLCGANGGYPVEEPHRPECRRCRKKAAKAARYDGSTLDHEPKALHGLKGEDA